MIVVMEVVTIVTTIVDIMVIMTVVVKYLSWFWNDACHGSCYDSHMKLL